MQLTSNLVFFGTPEFAVPSLQAILESGRRVALVVTQPDRASGRGRTLKTSPVKDFALRSGLSIAQPKKMKDPAFWQDLREKEAKVFVVVAYGRIFPSEILAIPEIFLNVHASLLPRWRGASPINHSLLAGDQKTGVSIMKLVEEMDAGDVMLMKDEAIRPEDTAGDLFRRLSKLGAEALIEALDLLDRGQAVFKPQDPQEVTYAPPIEKNAGEIDWSRPAGEIVNQIRGLSPWPGTFTFHDGKRIKIHQAEKADRKIGQESPGTVLVEGKKLLVAASDFFLEVAKIQKEGKTIQSAGDFIQGYRNELDGSKWG